VRTGEHDLAIPMQTVACDDHQKHMARTHILALSLLFPIALTSTASAFKCGDVVDNKCVVKKADIDAERAYADGCMKDKAKCTRSSADGDGYHRLANDCGTQIEIGFDDQMIKEGLQHQFEPMTEADAIAAALVKRCKAHEPEAFKKALKKLKRIELKSRPSKGDSDTGAPVYAFSKATGVLTMKVPANSRVNPDNDGGDGDLVAWLTAKL
jgi:hypothetical protein